MTHVEIDELVAGPELDALACRKLGIEPLEVPSWICGVCLAKTKIWPKAPCRCIRGSSGVHWVQTPYPAISNHADLALAALLLLISNDDDWAAFQAVYEAFPAPLAIARALAKLGVAK